MNKQLLTSKEVCEWLNISRSTLVRLRQSGFPEIKMGKSVRFDPDKIKEWLKEQNKLI